jgi:hypothetical protein
MWGWGCGKIKMTDEHGVLDEVGILLEKKWLTPNN